MFSKQAPCSKIEQRKGVWEDVHSSSDRHLRSHPEYQKPLFCITLDHLFTEAIVSTTHNQVLTNEVNEKLYGAGAREEFDTF